MKRNPKSPGKSAPAASSRSIPLGGPTLADGLTRRAFLHATAAQTVHSGGWGERGNVGTDRHQVLQAKLGTVTGTSIAVDVQRATGGVSWGTGYWGIALRE